MHDYIKCIILTTVTHNACSFLGCVNRIVCDDYVPTVQDILHARLTTTGVIETTFTFKGYHFRSAICTHSPVKLSVMRIVQ